MSAADESRSYQAPTTVEGVVAALATGGRVIAGGTDLVVMARREGTPLPLRLVDIGRVAALRSIARVEGGGLRLGPLVRHEELANEPAIRSRFTALADACAIVGSPATRWTGTIGGNVMSASPGAATIGPLICFDTMAMLVSSAGTRSVPVAELVSGPRVISAREDELLAALDLAPTAEGTGSCYARLGLRRQMEVAIAGAAALVRIVDGRISDARVVITAVAPTIRRVPEAEAELVGSTGDPPAVEAAAIAAQAACESIEDDRVSKAYRTAMARVVCRRVVSAAIDRATGAEVPIPASLALLGADAPSPENR